MSPFEDRAPLVRKLSPLKRWYALARETWQDPERRQAALEHLRERAYHYRAYLFCVGLPTLVTALYYLLIAAPQYLSEAHFIVMGSAAPQKPEAGLSQAISAAGPDMRTLAVIDFLTSNDAVAALNERVKVAEIYRKPRIDFLARIRSSPTVEEISNYLFGRAGMVHVNYNFMNFVGVIKVFAFDAEDARTVADGMLTLGDQLVDRLNQRALDDALRVARGEVKRAEDRVAAVADKITKFRTNQKELDYTKSADTILDVVGKLENDLAQARADVTAARTYMKPDSAAFVELENRVKALEGQIASQKERLTGPDGAIAPEMANYERLVLERNFANQDYQVASQALEQAYLQAQKQQLFLVRTVDAKVPQKAEYPRGILTVLTMFVTLSVMYGIGWLILAGVREHAG